MKSPNTSLTANSLLHPLRVGLQIFVKDVADGFFAITHNGFALLGLALFFAVATLQARPDWRDLGEEQLFGWLRARQELTSSLPGQMEASARATATNPKNLTKPQAAVARWLSRKYKVAPEPISALVTEAWETGRRTDLEPNLILAVMAIESGFNPFAQSNVGAQGLMQVMTRVHSEKYEGFGGNLAAFDPVSNLRVGVKILKDYIDKAGSLEGGLHMYVGDSSANDDGVYSSKVLAEQARLKQVAQGVKLPTVVTPPSLTAATGGLVENLWEKAQKLTSFNEEPAESR